MREGLIYALTLMIVVSGVGIGSLSGISGTGGSASSPASVMAGNSTYVSVVNRQLGLALVLSLSNVTVDHRPGISVTVKVVNTLSSQNNVSLGNSWDFVHPYNISVLRTDPCVLPAGVVLFKGYYTPQNLSSGRALRLYGGGTAGCPPVTANYYDFDPLSDNATFTNEEPSFHFSVEGTVNMTGYWTGDVGRIGVVQYNSLDGGTNTIVSLDEWGDQVLLHFSIPTTSTCLLGSVVGPQCLQVSVGPNPSVDGKTTINAVFTNTSNMTVNLGDYMLYDNVTDTQGNLVHQGLCVVLYPNPALPPGGTWECDDASWTMPFGTYNVVVYVYSTSLHRVIASADVTAVND